MRQTSRIISAAPERLRSHKGAVGFQHDPLQRNVGSGFDGFAGIFEGQHTGKTDVPAHIHQLPCHFRRTGVAVEYTGNTLKFLDDAHAVIVGIPFVDDYRHVKLLCQFHLQPEGFLLDLPGDVLIVIVQTNLTNGLDLGVEFT